MVETDFEQNSRCRPRELCEQALSWARNRNYAGWDPYDGLNSPYVDSFARNWLLRLIGTHFVHKCPINVRRPLSVPKQRNPKGIGLFAMTYLSLYETTGKEDYLAEAERLLDWLEQNQSTAYPEPCWGYNFGWQNGRKFFLPAYSPSIVVSTFCARAFLQHYETTGDEQSLSVATETVDFIRSHINTKTINGHTVFTYTDSDSFVVINANALAAALFAAVGSETGDEELLARSDELASFVSYSQADSGGWYYAVPRTDSHLSHDNFHTGFVLEALGEYLKRRGPDRTIRDAYESGLQFYRRELFEGDGAPKFEHDKAFPRDAHSAGQAIRTFALDGRPSSVEMAESIIGWSSRRLYDSEGYFYRRRGRIFDDKTPYMRWSQAWMCYGLSTFVRTRDSTQQQTTPIVDSLSDGHSVRDSRTLADIDNSPKEDA